MSRRTRALVAVVATLATGGLIPSLLGGAHAAEADPTKEFPTLGCATVVDEKGDARPMNQASAPVDPDLDLTSLTMRSTPTALLAYVGVDKLAAGPASFDAHRFAVDFTFNGHVFTMSGSSSTRGSHAIRDVAGNSGAVGKVIQLGVDVPPLATATTERGLKASGLTVNFDVPNSRVVFMLPIADIEKYGLAKFGGVLSAIAAKSQTDTGVLSSQADITVTANGATSTDTWTVGDNKCFTQKTAIVIAVTKVGTARAITATLSAGTTALAGQKLVVTVNGKKVATLTTNAKGLVSYKGLRAGQTVKVAFAGAPGYEASTATKKA